MVALSVTSFNWPPTHQVPTVFPNVRFPATGGHSAPLRVIPSFQVPPLSAAVPAWEPPGRGVPPAREREAVCQMLGVLGGEAPAPASFENPGTSQCHFRTFQPATLPGAGHGRPGRAPASAREGTGQAALPTRRLRPSPLPGRQHQSRRQARGTPPRPSSRPRSHGEQPPLRTRGPVSRRGPSGTGGRGPGGRGSAGPFRG